MESTRGLEANQGRALAAPCHKELQFDARYGWTYDTFFDPAALANSEGRGRFALLSILAASFQMSVAMIAQLEEASCAYTFRGAKYARKTAASLKKGLVRKKQRPAATLRPSHLHRPVRKQGLKLSQGTVAPPELESGQGAALQRSMPRVLESEVGGLKIGEGMKRVRLEGLETVQVSTSAADREPSKLYESVTGSAADVLSRVDELERAEAASLRVEEPRGETQGAGESDSLHIFEAEPGFSGDRLEIGKQRAKGLPDSNLQREGTTEIGSEQWGAETGDSDTPVEVGDRGADEERLPQRGTEEASSSAEAADDERRNVVLETARAQVEGDALPLEAEARQGEGTELAADGPHAEHTFLLERNRSDGGDLGEDQSRTVVRRAESDAGEARTKKEGGLSQRQVERGFEEQSRRRMESRRGPEAELAPLAREREGNGDLMHPARAFGRVETEVRALGSPVTIWRAPEGFPKPVAKSLYVVEAERFRRGYREDWHEGRKMLEVEKRRLRSQLGRRMSVSKGLHRFLREEFGESKEGSQVSAEMFPETPLT